MSTNTHRFGTESVLFQFISKFKLFLELTPERVDVPPLLATKEVFCLGVAHFT